MPKKDFIIVAIDGGAAAGKSSTSRALSSRFNLMHVDTGSFYRATTLKLLEAGVPAQAGEALVTGLAGLQLDTKTEGNQASIVINGWTPDAAIRSEQVNANVSHYAAIPEVRKFLFDYQRSQAEIAKERGFAGLVMEGRDIGSIIFPEADLRLYLYADPAKRAARRAAEGLTDSIEQRDKMDSSRKSAPLQVPEGATLVDSSELNLEQVVEHVSELVSAAYEN
ncbi:(d)CMP kinase [Pelagicoccus albus]|uniref:Cytidylate kinase n=1 Tax=Pelagicoccus albus TaxID=415222 RepID=A0A7X1E8D6_9BACT|nr:(d)CMP kinase [Pelagicoccus albus]MBC2604672.1 (d)CMP kinase [Pelagicoccus albus]